MKTVRIICLIAVLASFVGSLIGQTGNSKPPVGIPPPPPPQPSGSDWVVANDPLFGNYYKIGKYPIRVPFNEPPNVSPVSENAIFSLTSYQYAYPSPKDDINILYGIDVCEYKNDSALKSPKLKIDYIAGIQKNMYKTSFQGNLLDEKIGGSDGSYFLRQKIRIVSKDIGEIYLTSLYFYSKGNVVRLFVFTPNNIDNKRVEDYFASVKFD